MMVKYSKILGIDIRNEKHIECDIPCKECRFYKVAENINTGHDVQFCNKHMMEIDRDNRIGKG